MTVFPLDLSELDKLERQTVFLRISQFFENTLDSERWHTDLLEKMTLNIEGVRLPAVSQSNYANLLELLKFRHFRRYYFELDHDWDRPDFLIRKLNSAHPGVKQDLEDHTVGAQSSSPPGDCLAQIGQPQPVGRTETPKESTRDSWRRRDRHYPRKQVAVYWVGRGDSMAAITADLPPVRAEIKG